MNIELNKLTKDLPPPLPEKVEDWHRVTKAERTLNDMVEDVHRSLAGSDQYKAFLYAVYDEQAVEGSLSCDNTEAARMIREQAKKMKYDELAREKLATIAKAMGVVLRRYGQSRKQRRNMIGGTIVPENSGNGE